MLRLFSLCLLYLPFVTCSTTVDWTNEASKNAEQLSNEMDRITENVMGYDNYQNYYDTLSFKRRKLNGGDMLEKMANNFGKKYADRTSAVVHLRQIVEDSITTENDLKECCNIKTNDLEKDGRFKQSIGKNACYRKSKSTTDEFGFLSKNFEKACSDNLARMPFLRWQYFASESGITTLYPEIKVKDCGSYDARYRPFYVQSNVPEPKDVVIVIDRSGSMENHETGRSLMDIAKEAAKTVVKTFNQHDRVAVIGFSDVVVAMGSNPAEACFKDELAMATNKNTLIINQFIDEIKYHGVTNYGAALEKAFDYFEKSSTIDGRERVILFMSDGKPSDSKELIFTTLKDRNMKLNNSVILMTYGLGADNFTILQSMADQDGSFYDVPDGTHSEAVKPGLFTHVADPTNLRQEMATYYTFFSRKASRKDEAPIWTLPYLDAWGIGLLMSVTSPVRNEDGDIIGIVGTDLTLDDLLSGAVYFRPTELSYIFIIDSFGFVIYHPLFKYPEDYEVKHIDITAFEKSSDVTEVIADMKRGGSGSKTFVSERIAPGGSSRLYGVKTFSVNTEAHWKQIPRTKFSVCIILAEGDEESTLQPVSPRDGDDFLYHRIDLVAPQTPCRNYNRYCAMNQSAIALSPRAYVDPEAYLNNKETSNDVNSLKTYMMTGRGGSQFERGIRDSVWATMEAERFWEGNINEEIEKYVLWKFIGTKEGILRIYPGTTMPKNFDPTVRPWYRNALAHKGRTTVTLPYNDTVSKQHVITITKVIFEGKPSGDRNYLKDEIIAVMGIDISVQYLDEMINDIFPMCQQKEDYTCSLVDSAGFLLYRHDVNYNALLPEHITEKEPMISESLISSKIMMHSKCIIMEEGYMQRTYEIKITETFSGKTKNDCFSFQVIPISRTNMYMIVRETFSSCRSEATCVCTAFATKNHRCISTSQSCECPCTSAYEDYNTCSNTYGYSGKRVPDACMPSPASLLEAERIEGDVSGDLPQCNVFIPNKKYDEGKRNIGIIVGCIVGIIVLLIILVLVFVFCVKRKDKDTTPAGSRKRKQSDRLPQTPTAPNHIPIEDIYINATPPPGHVDTQS